jgi:hypothetical protein
MRFLGIQECHISRCPNELRVLVSLDVYVVPEDAPGCFTAEMSVRFPDPLPEGWVYKTKDRVNAPILCPKHARLSSDPAASSIIRKL